MSGSVEVGRYLPAKWAVGFSRMILLLRSS